MDLLATWHLTVGKGRKTVTVDTFNKATDVVAALTTLTNPEAVTVYNRYTGYVSDGRTFLSRVNVSFALFATGCAVYTPRNRSRRFRG